MGDRFCIVILMVLFWAGRVAASVMQPAELPPSDFSARQYIDSRGCVFLREADGGWTPRLYRDGEMVCGYPPTLATRPVGVEGALALYGADDPPQTPEDLLSEIIFPNLREGEQVGDQAPFQPLPDMGPEPFGPGPVDFLQAEIAAQSAVRYAMAGARQPNRELCRLLGYDHPISSGEGNSSRLSDDPSQGFCNGLAAGEVSRLAFVRPARPLGPESEVHEKDEQSFQAGEGEAPEVPPNGNRLREQQTGATPSPVTAPPNKPSKIERSRAKVGKTVSKAPAERKAQATTGAAAGMIPANARYVQVGIYSDAEQMEAALHRLSALGFPVLRQVKPTPSARLVLMSGPFDSRQSIVMALDRIRKAGFVDAIPR